MFDRLRSNWLIPACVALLLLTALAAGLQYHWINRVSDAERHQRHEVLAATLRNFSGEFRETILRVVPYFRHHPSGETAAAFESDLLELSRQWRNNAERPQLLSSVSIATQDNNGASFKRLLLGDDQFKEAAWPAEYALYRTILEQRLRLSGRALFPPRPALEFAQGRLVLIFPLVIGRPPPESLRPEGVSRQVPPTLSGGAVIEGLEGIEGPSFPQSPEPRELVQSLKPVPEDGPGRPPELKGWCFLELDPNYLHEHLIPELVGRYYGPADRSDYQVAIVTNPPLDLVYGSVPLTDEFFSHVDAGIVLLDANSQQGRPGPPPAGPPPNDGPPNGRRLGPPPPPPPPQPFISGPEGVPIARMGPSGEEADGKTWLLVVKNKWGSLDSMVEHSRRHNLAVSFGILVLLAGSIVMLMVATTRARNLAQQQMEFVAGVSHELRTPLTVIQSTSYNLSQGMIQDPGRVQQYGEVIQGEARRLINLVERMLSFAGIQSGRRIYDPQPTNVAEIINRSLAEYAHAFSVDGWQVEQHVQEDLPPVLTDGPAIESALKNLFENALKYASDGKWLSVRAALASSDNGRREVQIIVADRGPGIPPQDLMHIFEAFYRGRGVIGSSITGAGLGLCLVERNLRALGGKVTVESPPNGGASFTLHLSAIVESAVTKNDTMNSDDEKQDSAN